MTTLERPVDLVSHGSGHSRKSQNEQVAVQHRSEPRVENLEGEALVEEMLARKRRACVRSMIREHPTEPAICGVHELRTRDRQLHCPLCVHPAVRRCFQSLGCVTWAGASKGRTKASRLAFSCRRRLTEELSSAARVEAASRVSSVLHDTCTLFAKGNSDNGASGLADTDIRHRKRFSHSFRRRPDRFFDKRALRHYTQFHHEAFAQSQLPTYHNILIPDK